MDNAVSDYLDKVASPVPRRDADTLLELMDRVTGEPARMWGSSIVGFGQYHYKYSSGREETAPRPASPRARQR